jgi:hypothetical protein
MAEQAALRNAATVARFLSSRLIPGIGWALLLYELMQYFRGARSNNWLTSNYTLDLRWRFAEIRERNELRAPDE